MEGALSMLKARGFRFWEVCLPALLKLVWFFFFFHLTE